MTFQDFGAIGDLVGGVAVVITLVYLAVQIKQNTKVARAATRQAISESTENLGSDLINNREIAEIFVKHLSGNELSTVENLRLQARCYRDMQHWENIHYQYNEGLVSKDQWEGFRKNLSSLLAIDAYREYWEHESFHYSDAFQAEIASLLKEPRTEKSSASLTARFRERNDR